MNYGTKQMWMRRLSGLSRLKVLVIPILTLAVAVALCWIIVTIMVSFRPPNHYKVKASDLKQILLESDASIRTCMTDAIKKKSTSYDPVITYRFTRKQEDECLEAIENTASTVEQKDAIASAVAEQERQVTTPETWEDGDMPPDEVIKWLSKNSPAINMCAMEKVKKHYDTKDYAVRRQDMRAMISACSSSLSKQAQIEAINKLEKK